MLTQKDYQQIATVLSEAITTCEQVKDLEAAVFITNWVIAPLAHLFAAENPGFDSTWFCEASNAYSVVSIHKARK